MDVVENLGDYGYVFPDRRHPAFYFPSSMLLQRIVASLFLTESLI